MEKEQCLKAVAVIVFSQLELWTKTSEKLIRNSRRPVLFVLSTWCSCYSYASVSLTVNFDACLAGSALANVPITMVKTSQMMMPLIS